MSNLAHRTVLITGGTGSFGNAMLRRLLAADVKSVRIFSRDEKKQDDMRQLYRDPRLKFYIGDVRNRDSVEEATAGADYVFHAAALKQVPACEFYPLEAIRTNTLGADNVLHAAIRHQVKNVVVLSTDKAAYPINAMGMTKALMEKVMVARSRIGAEQKVICCATRYGNVMASRGSVIPLFVQKIEAGEPLTVTDPNMTRFLMSLEEAVELVLFAFEHARAGDLFVQKAPAATLADLAEAIKRLLHADNPIKIIGTRHGEKLHETLLTREERACAEDLGGYYRVPADGRDLNYELYFTQGDPKIAELEDYNSSNTRRLKIAEIMVMLRSLPEMREAMVRRGLPAAPVPAKRPPRRK